MCLQTCKIAETIVFMLKLKEASVNTIIDPKWNKYQIAMKYAMKMQHRPNAQKKQQQQQQQHRRQSPLECVIWSRGTADDVTHIQLTCCSKIAGKNTTLHWLHRSTWNTVAHCHCHTQYNITDGIKKMLNRVKACATLSTK